MFTTPNTTPNSTSDATTNTTTDTTTDATPETTPHATSNPTPNNEADAERVYEIPESNLSTLEAALTKLNKRAAKLGCKAPELLPAEPRFVDEPIRDQHGHATGATRRVFRFVVVAEPVKLAGWAFSAVIDHVTNEGESLNLLRAMPGVRLPKAYRTAKATCDHCNTQRRRNETFVIWSETEQRFARVGRQCLVDYLGGDTAQQILAMAEILSAFAAACSENEGYSYGGSSDWRFPAAIVLAYTHAALETNRGAYISKKAAYGNEGVVATADTVWSWLTYGLRKRSPGEPKPPTLTEKDTEAAEKALTWAMAIDPDTDSDYLYNVRAFCGVGAIPYKGVGIVCSAFPAYLREVPRDALAGSKALGSVGDRFGGKAKGSKPALALTITEVRDIPSEFGTTTLFRFEDADRNVLAWYYSGGPFVFGRKAEIGDKVLLSGTVKAHKPRREGDGMETRLARCSLKLVE
jgi:hypothetical protein